MPSPTHPTEGRIGVSLNGNLHHIDPWSVGGCFATATPHSDGVNGGPTEGIDNDNKNRPVCPAMRQCIGETRAGARCHHQNKKLQEET